MYIQPNTYIRVVHILIVGVKNSPSRIYKSHQGVWNLATNVVRKVSALNSYGEQGWLDESDWKKPLVSSKLGLEISQDVVSYLEKDN